MGEVLHSLGLDVGTTSTQLILSRLTVENLAGPFSVPQMEISRREILYKSQVHFTPLLDEDHVDGAALRKIVEGEYERAGVSREQVDTGAIIITGETSRKENAAAVLKELEGFAGEFVVATAGPDLESVLAAKGSGAVAYGEGTGERVLHMDIGGGTSNLALIEEGKIRKTGCLNVGGRLLKLDPSGKVTYVSPVLRGLWEITPGQCVTEEQVKQVAELLVQALEMAAGLRPRTELLDRLTTAGATVPEIFGAVTLSFSGGVAECIRQDYPWLAFGDMGPALGRAIRESRLCRGPYVLGQETIRATVIGAGCHSAQLSGSTVYYRNVRFPMKNLPVVRVPKAWVREPRPEVLQLEMAKQEGTAVVSLPELEQGDYAHIRLLAEAIAAGIPQGPVLVCLETDAAKALGQALALRMPEEREILCIDRVMLEEGCYLDVGTPVGPALPVVIKTLVLNR